MIEQIGKALNFAAFFTESKLGKTGLTVTVDVMRWDGSASTLVTAGSATEVGDGFYAFTMPANLNTAAGLYLATFKTATATVDFQWVPSCWTVGEAWVQTVGGTVNANVIAVKGQTVQGAGTPSNPWGP